MTEHQIADREVPTRRGASRSPRLQRKLVVGSADDPLELEADRVADEVVRVLRRATATPPPALVAGRGSNRIARHAGHGGDHHHDHHEHRPEVGLAGGDISAELVGRIRSASGGTPLGGRTLARMESGFGASFADVRVHAASPLPAQVAADAFTTGTDIHFAPGRFAPGTAAGEHLLAHELTHVVQQGGARVARHVCDSACEHGDRMAPSVGRSIARHACDSSCRHDVGDERDVHLPDLDVAGLLSRSIAADITRADTGYAVRRHSSWEHMLIGDLDPQSLATLGAAQDTKNMRPTDKVYVGTTAQRQSIMVTKEDVKHVIFQEINRLKRFQAAPPMFEGFGAMQGTEDELKRRDRNRRLIEARNGRGDVATEQGKEWDLKLVAVPNAHGPAFLVTYGEMNTLGDFFGSVEEMVDVDHAWMSKLIRGVRQSTMHELMKVYTDISGFEDDVDYEGNVIKTKRQKSRDELEIGSEDFRAADGSKDLVSLGGILNELKLMGLPPGNQQTKPQVGGEAATDYSSTLARNACHFAPESWHAWYGYHMKARAYARRAYDKREDAFTLRLRMGSPHYRGDAQADREEVDTLFAEATELANWALVNNGFGDHYMQDSYAAGHLINKTLIMQHYVRWLDKNPGKWDAHRDKNWRVMQQMAYNQPEMTSPTQHVKANIGTRQLPSGKVVGTARNPQSVENISTGDWRDRAHALGLQVPSSLSNSDARDLLLLWQTRCVQRAKVRNTRVQTFKTIRAWATTQLHMSDDDLMKALNALFDDGIVRMGSYSTKDRITQHTLKPGTDLTLREDYVPKNATNLLAVTNTPGAMEDMALGVAYNDYLEFMNSAFLQKATNFVHDKFCLEGLAVQAGDSGEIFRIYGDDSMFKANAGPGLLHSGTTSHMSRNAIMDIAATGDAAQTGQQILARFPAAVRLDDRSVVPLETWHHGELLHKLENGIFESMSKAGMTQIKNKGVGLKPGGLGTITANTRPGGHEVF